MAVNTALESRMCELSLTRAELADRMNQTLDTLIGRPGAVTERMIYRWLSGETRWPQTRHREVLAALFDCDIEALGFQPPSPTAPREPPVKRRAFLTAATGAAATAALPTQTTRYMVGESDALRLRAHHDALTAVDDQRGGHAELEKAALAGVARVAELQQRSASERVQRQLYALGADFAATAAFSCIDARKFDSAHNYLNRAAAFAGLSQDSVAQLRVWNFTSMLAHHCGRPSDALAAARTAQRTWAARQDPMLASLVHARAAVGYSDNHERQAALRSLGTAVEALNRADPDRPRPPWMGFYSPAELMVLASVIHINLGNSAAAEACSHRSLSAIPARFRRNRAYSAARLALAQACQREVESACSTAHTVLDLMAGDPLPGRMRTVLGDVHRRLLVAAPDAPVTLEWADRARREWSRTA